MDFQALRKEYEQEGMIERDLPECPFACFRQWLSTAIACCPGDWFEPNAMCLATSDLQGHVTARVVLLKGVTETGIRFFTNYHSVKGKQLASNSQASVVFHWPYLGQQVRLEGAVEKTIRAVSDDYFQSRPKSAQLGAWVSEQSQRIENRQVMESRLETLAQRYQQEKVPLPEGWGGYELTPRRWEFWQGRASRLHDRIVYEKNDPSQANTAGSAWSRYRLAP